MGTSRPASSFLVVLVLAIGGCQDDDAPTKMSASAPDSRSKAVVPSDPAPASGAPPVDLSPDPMPPDDADSAIEKVLVTRSAVEDWHFTVGVNDIDVTDLDELSGTERVVGAAPSARDPRRGLEPVVRTPGKATDRQFDWRAIGVARGVRDQTNECRACWAFSAIAILEAQYEIERPGIDFNASEQRLVDCLGGCRRSTVGKAATYLVDTGTPTEADEPYKARAGTCRTVPPGQLRGYRTGYVIKSGRAPTIKQMKEALVHDGPISAYILATSAFMAYSGGVFDEFASAEAAGEGHSVVIVGWNDDLPHRRGAGAWLVKNSWGSGWGVFGFGWVAYEANDIGYNARWIRLAPPPPPVGETGTDDAEPQ